MNNTARTAYTATHAAFTFTDEQVDALYRAGFRLTRLHAAGHVTMTATTDRGWEIILEARNPSEADQGPRTYLTKALHGQAVDTARPDTLEAAIAQAVAWATE